MEQTKGDLIWSGLKNVTILYVRNVDDKVTNTEPVILVWALSFNLSEWILQNWEQRKLIVAVFSITSLRKRLHEMKVRIMGMSYLSIRPLSVRPYTSHRILLNVFLLHFILVVQEYVKQLGAVRANGIPTSFRFVQVRRHFSSETSWWTKFCWHSTHIIYRFDYDTTLILNILQRGEYLTNTWKEQRLIVLETKRIFFMRNIRGTWMRSVDKMEVFSATASGKYSYHCALIGF